MSLQSSMAVMKAKLAGNVQALQALAMQGDFEAVAALKEMMDKKAYAQDVSNNMAEQQPEVQPVLEKMVGTLQPPAPQSGLAAYAGGGRAFAGGGGPDRAFTPQAMVPSGLDTYAPPIKSSLPGWLESLISGAGDVAERLSPQGIADAVRNPNYSNEGRNDPGPTVSLAPPNAAKQAQRQGVGAPKYTGIAAAAAPAAAGTAPEPRGMAAHTDGAAPDMPDLPAAQDQTDEQLRAHLAALEPLQKKRDALHDLSRKQLEDAYNAKVKNLTPTKYDQVMSFLAGVQGKGGRSAAQALGAGAQHMYGTDKEAQTKLADAKELYAHADLLEQQAQVKEQRGDLQDAYDLRQKAAELQRKLALEKSTTELNKAHAKYWEKAGDAQIGKADAALTKANRGSGAGAIKPMTPAQEATWIQREKARLITAAGKDLNRVTPLEDSAAQQQAVANLALIKRQQAQPGGLAAAAGAQSPATTGVKFLGFE